jgi:hypothetical protein
VNEALERKYDPLKLHFRSLAKAVESNPDFSYCLGNRCVCRTAKCCAPHILRTRRQPGLFDHAVDLLLFFVGEPDFYNVDGVDTSPHDGIAMCYYGDVQKAPEWRRYP